MWLLDADTVPQIVTLGINSSYWSVHVAGVRYGLDIAGDLTYSTVQYAIQTLVLIHILASSKPTASHKPTHSIVRPRELVLKALPLDQGDWTVTITNPRLSYSWYVACERFKSRS